EFVVVFPSPNINRGSGQLAAAQQLQIPEKTWLEFDTQQGIERLWLVFAEAPVPDFDAVKEFASAQTRGLITDSAQNKAVKDFLSAHSAPKPDYEKGDTLTTLKTS